MIKNILLVVIAVFCVRECHAQEHASKRRKTITEDAERANEYGITTQDYVALKYAEIHNITDITVVTNCLSNCNVAYGSLPSGHAFDVREGRALARVYAADGRFLWVSAHHRLFLVMKYNLYKSIG